jgi:hypothetical protein
MQRQRSQQAPLLRKLQQLPQQRWVPTLLLLPLLLRTQ